MTAVPLGGLRRADRPRTRRPRTEVAAGGADEAVALLGSVATLVCLVLLWVVAQLLLLGGLSESRAQGLLYEQFREEVASATAPTGGVIAPGAPVATLTVPVLGIRSAVVVEGTASGDLTAGPGHLRSTPLPGQAGISVVLGKASTYGAPFSRIASLRPGDQVIAQNAQGRVVYTVSGIRRTGDPIPTPPTGVQGRLTLVTAEGSGPLAALGAGTAVFVDAVATKAEPAGGAPGTVVPPSEQLMGRDTGALPVLVLMLALLLAVAYGVSVARRRFPIALVWVLAAPVAIALAWSTTDVVMRLLPNLM